MAIELNIKNIANQFKTVGEFSSFTSLGEGLINDTYLLETTTGKYVLQKINHHIFKNIPALTRNKVLITQHIASKKNSQTIQFLPTHKALYYYQNSEGYWNLSKYIENSVTILKVSNPKIAFEGGRAIAEFQSYLTDFDQNNIVDPIPDFHNTSKRIRELNEICRRNTNNRKLEVEDLIELANRYQKFIVAIDKQIKNNSIPKRITHNDTKISNVLFDANEKAICMIDLDTCMKGSVLHDFGDALRSGTNTGNEDNPENVAMDIELFQAYAEGYLSIAKTFLCKTELENLVYAGPLITYEQFVRFLSDYLDGDKYYKIHHPKHNLERAESQAKLFLSMMDQINEMKLTIKKLSE